MEMIFKLFGGFVQTLREANKIFLTNGRLMASIASFTALTFSFLLITNFLSLRPLLTDLIIKQSFLLTVSPGTADFTSLVVAMTKDLGFLTGLEWIFIFVQSLASVYFSTATILASSVTLAEKNLSRRDLMLAAARLWKRPLVTFFYVTIFELGYVSLLLAVLIPFLLLRTGFSAISVVTCVSAMLFYAYLAVTWTVGTIVSVLEDKYGMEALGQAARLVKGMELRGFCLSILMGAVSYGVMQILRLVLLERSYVMELLTGLIVVNGLWLVRMYGLMTFTVMYHDSKRIHGEEVESSVSLEYTKIPAMPLISENLP